MTSRSKTAQKEELLTFGYIRKQQLRIDTNLPSIPTPLIKLIALFVELLDRWDTNKCQEGLQISEKYLRLDGDSISKTMYHCCNRVVPMNSKWYHSFGTDVISKGCRRKWTLQLNLKKSTTNSQDAVSDRSIVALIGVIDNDRVTAIRNKLRDFTNADCFGYGLATANHRLYHRDQKHVFSYLNGYPDFSDTTALQMQLDLTGTGNDGTLSYSIEGISTESASNVAFDDVDVNRSYRLCIALYTEDQIAIIG